MVFILFVFLFAAVSLRLFFWQVLSFDSLKGFAERQTLTSLIIPAKRGEIYASDGSPLVINQRAFTVFAEQLKIKDQKNTASLLAKTLDMYEGSVSAKLKDTSVEWVSIASKVDEDKVETLKRYQLPGIGVSEETKRFYPEASMAAHLLGFVGKNYKGEDQGYFGLEGFYDEQLRGRGGLRRQEEDALGHPIILGKNEEIEATAGRNLYLTIDKTVQYIVENKLKEGIERFGAKGGTVVVLEPSSGAVLAMASYPSYDPGRFQNYSLELYKNPAVSFSYEPGSTFKVLIMAAALNEGKVKPETKYKEEGQIELGGYTIKTWNEKYHGEITLSQILDYSSNVGMVFVAKEMGEETIHRYLESLGFGYPTEIDLQEETVPKLRPRQKWYEIDYATVSFGQGIAITPLQMVKAVAAVANGGKLMKPYVVKSIHMENGKIVNINPKVEREVFKKEVATFVSEMMVSAVENGETRLLRPVGYRIAGKTGTAQIPIAGHYDTEKTIASFVGFAPVNKPKFVMLVTIREPTASPWGSETAAPIFFNIIKELFSYYGISPSD